MLRTANICIDAHGPVAQATWGVSVLDDRDRDDEVTRLLERGATLVDDLRVGPDRGWAVMADPQGNAPIDVLTSVGSGGSFSAKVAGCRVENRRTERLSAQ